MQDETLKNWSDVLDEFEVRLSLYGTTLSGGEVPPAFSIPQGIGRMPIVLTDRATLIRARQLDLENQMRDRIGLYREILSRRQANPHSVFVDARA